MGPREGNEADTVSPVIHLTERNRFHEYFMGFEYTFPHIHNLFVLLETVFLSQGFKEIRYFSIIKSINSNHGNQ